MTQSDALIWEWGRLTLYSFTKSTSFVQDENLSYYEYSKHHANIVAMKDNYFEWIVPYGIDGYRVSCQDESWVFKNKTSFLVRKYESSDEIDSIYKVPSGKGEHYVTPHVGCAETD